MCPLDVYRQHYGKDRPSIGLRVDPNAAAMQLHDVAAYEQTKSQT
jgi:hypothetical protein